MDAAKSPSPDATSRRRRRWLLGVLLGAAVLVVGMGVWPAQSPPSQPIRFSHKAHVKQAKCPACHTTVNKAMAAGVPKLADCLDCHEGTQSKDPANLKEEAKIEPYAKAKAEIPWMRVWKLPQNVMFSHRVHVAVAKVPCQACHGPIETLDAPPTGPLKRLTMNDCLGCHEAWRWPDQSAEKHVGPTKVAAVRRVSTDCNACHR